jgi:curved DNA-binding protein CbpA
VADDPFSTLGLPAWAGLTDDDVRAAWRRIAAATHPDREDGGDPVRFGAAAAAYMLLRTSFERGEALADLAAGDRPHSGQRHGGLRPGGLGHGRLGRARLGRGRLRHCGARYGGHRHRERRQARRGAHRVSADGAGAGGYRAAAARLAGRLAGQFGLLTTGRGLGLRVISAALLAAATVAAVGVTPATIGLLAGALTVSGWALWRRGGWGR